MTENKYCVYLHRRKDNNEVFYVGQGTLERSKHAAGRSPAWIKIKKESEGFTVEHVAVNLTKNEALTLEANQIKLHSDTIVNLQTSSSTVKELNFSDFNDRFYIDSSSPTGLKYKVNVFTHRCGNLNNVLKYKIDDIAGSVDRRSCKVGFNGKYYLAHRIVYLLFNGALSSESIIDHIDGNPFNNNISNLRCVTTNINRRNAGINKQNKTGVCGVSYLPSRNEFIYRATVRLLCGKKKVKSFSCKKYGKEEAFRLACEWRKSMIDELNALGAGYSPRHGT